MQKFEIKIYSNKNGKSYYLEWYNSLTESVKQKVRDRLFRVRNGNLGDFKSLGDGIYELRFFIGSGYRIYFGKDGFKMLILLCGGDKSSQKKDIKTAKEIWQSYKGE